MAAAELDGRPVVISGSSDRTVRVWDLATGAPVGGPFTGHSGAVHAVAAAELDGRPVVISGSGDETVRVWDLATGTPVGDPFTGHDGAVHAVAVAELDGRPGGHLRQQRRDGAGVGPGHRRPGRRPVHRPRRRGARGGGRRSWMAARWSSPAAATGRCGCGTWPPAPRSATRSPATTAAVHRGGGGGAGWPPGGHLRQQRPRRCGCGTWPPAPRSATRSPATAAAVHAVAAAELDGRPVVISGSSDETVRVWDLATGTPVGDPFTGHDGPVHAVAAAELDGRPVVISGSSDETVRVWDLATGTPVGGPFTGHGGPVNAVVSQTGQGLIADGCPAYVGVGARERSYCLGDLP